MIRNYRPPENIMNDYFDEKADIWSVGCIIFELLTGEYLFELDENTKNNDPSYRDRLHLKQIFEIFGVMDRSKVINCDFKKDLFDNKGNILKMKNLNFRSLDKILNEDFNFSIEDSKNILDYLKNFFIYDLENRFNCQNAISYLW